MKRGHEVFEDSEKVEPFVWRNEFIDQFSDYLLNIICEKYKKWKTEEVTYGERKGLKKGCKALCVLPGIDIPDTILEPRFDGTFCYLSLTRYKQVKPFSAHFRRKIEEKLGKALTSKNIFKAFEFGGYVLNQGEDIAIKFEYWLD